MVIEANAFRTWSIPLLVTAVVVVWVGTYHFSYLPLGNINHTDEFHTLDRTTNFARQGDWLNVYSGNDVSSRKPPLQYWMGAILLEQGVGLTSALRLPSAFFGLASFVATALLAFALAPKIAWAVPTSVLLLSSSLMFWDMTISAMLDSGATFFVTLALAGTILALKRPAWWYVVGIAVGLGAWQKAPIGLAIVLIYVGFLRLTQKFHSVDARMIWRNVHFRRAMLGGLGFFLLWYFWQAVQHGAGVMHNAIAREMLSRFTPSLSEEDLRWGADLTRQVIAGETALRGIGLLALAILPWRLGRWELLPLPLLMASYILLVIFADGNVYPRYSLIFVPLLASALAVVFLSAPGPKILQVAGLASVLLLSGGPVKHGHDLQLELSEMRKIQVDAFSRFGEMQNSDAPLFYCSWPRSLRVPSGLRSYYGSNGKDFLRLRGPEQITSLMADGVLEGPAFGICAEESMKMLEGTLTEIEIMDRVGSYVILEGVFPDQLTPN